MIPDSSIYICSNIKLRSDMAHTIYFSSLSAQRSYFAGKVVRTFTDYTITRNNVAYVGADIADSETWNYCMIEDKANGDSLMRKFYFIESVEYIDEETTALHLKLDVMQTYQHQPNGGYAGNLPTCFVEREHSVYDGKYAFNGDAYNTVEEPLDTGEFVTRFHDQVTGNSWVIMAAATVRLDLLSIDSTTFTRSYGQQINGMCSGVGYYFAPMSRSTQVAQIIHLLNNLGAVDAIQDLYIFPEILVDKYNEDTSTDTSPFVRLSRSVNTDMVIQIPTTIGSYTPRNKKLLQYPYTFFYLTDCAGLSAVYRPEYYAQDRSPGRFVIDIQVNPLSDAGILMFPGGTYKGIDGNKEEGIMINNYPRMPWISDQYKLWLAQTANTRQYNVDMVNFSHQYKEQQIDMQIVGAMGDAIAGGLTAVLTAGIGGWGQISGAASSMTSAALEQWANDKTFNLSYQQMKAQIKDHAVTPPQSKGGASGTLKRITGTIRGRIEVKTVDDMHARIIDEYFDHYGYATNSFKTPNIHSRPAWNFVKTAGFDAKLNIPQKYKVAISDCFNAGITFWKNGDQIGNYSQSNTASTPS